MKHMGELVREKRKEKRWTVSRLESKSGVCRMAIYKVEREGGGYLDTYERLFRAMGYRLEVVPVDMWNYCK